MGSDKIKLCEICKEREATDTHHKDRDHKNNKSNNVQEICVLCHAKIHGNIPKQSELKRLVIFRERAIKIRNLMVNQKRSFGRIEYILPERWNKAFDNWNNLIKSIEKEIKDLLDTGDYLLWNHLKSVKGISYNTGASLISYIDINKSDTVSQLWRYCGLDATHIKRTRKISEKEAKMFGNPYLKKTILGIIADSFIKQRTQPYRNLYDSEKEKQLNNGNNLTKLHAHRRAIRKMMKIFMAHYYVVSREIEGLPVTKPYVEVKLNHDHIIKPSF